MAAKAKRAWALIRKDTQNYGWILGRFSTQEAADRAYDRKGIAVTRKYPNAIPHLMYCVREVEPNEKKGTRVRI